MRRLRVRHTTTYKYAKPVAFGEHRMMLRPRDSHDLRLIATSIAISPAPATLRWLHDVFNNSVAVATFADSADHLQFESKIDLEHFESTEPDCPIEPYAETFPFSYSAGEAPDLHRSIERHYLDPDHEVDLWAKRFVNNAGPTNTLEMLTAITQSIKNEGFKYAVRMQQGCQLPADTLKLKSGSCRDFALLMIEAVRSLGLAARFVSGYVYVPPANGKGLVGGAATHAWLQIYLPGSGWMEFDPTNGIVGNRDLIRVAVVRDPSQALPIAGQWTGAPADFLGMEVDVGVSCLDSPDESAAESAEAAASN
jgi:transglutaminase-like putative cysteine protease